MPPINPSSPDRPAVVLASASRPALLEAVMADVDRQTWPGLEKVLSVPDSASLPKLDQRSDWRVVQGARGLAAQRNAALDTLLPEQVVFFFDDDAVVRSDYVENALRFFDEHSEVAGLTGRVLLDGAVSGEISEQRARTEVERSASEPLTGGWRAGRELYGCNFALRREVAPDLRFDPRLPLYSWLEDHDFARRLMPYGVLAKADDCVIVHRAASSGGRQSHERLGYSQLMNPVYLWRKGSFPAWLMVSEAGRRVAKNLVLSATGPERAWRRRRLRGNAIAALDAVRGRITPERITTL